MQWPEKRTRQLGSPQKKKKRKKKLKYKSKKAIKQIKKSIKAKQNYFKISIISAKARREKSAHKQFL